MIRRIVNVNVLHGEPTDGSGRVCIHLFVQDERGSFVEPNVLHMGTDEAGKATGKLIGKATRGRLACNPRRGVTPVKASGKDTAVTVTPRSDDARAVTCPRCCASPEYKKMMELLTAGEAGK